MLAQTKIYQEDMAINFTPHNITWFQIQMKHFVFLMHITSSFSDIFHNGNCIGFIKNGDGSAGYAIYKAKQFISTSDVIFGYADWLDEFTGLFFVAAQDMIQDKYSHGYKRNQQHLKGDKVMLPSNDNGEPDYDYMRQYMKNLMIKKYQSYLDYTK